MTFIFVFEVLVGVSMGVRVLRFVMVSWLAWLLLAINVFLLAVLGAVVAYHKMNCEAFRSVRKAVGTAIDAGGAAGNAAGTNAYAKQFEE